MGKRGAVARHARLSSDASGYDEISAALATSPKAGVRRLTTDFNSVCVRLAIRSWVKQPARRS
jgi:hypothetical protein